MTIIYIGGESLTMIKLLQTLPISKAIIATGIEYRAAAVYSFEKSNTFNSIILCQTCMQK